MAALGDAVIRSIDDGGDDLVAQLVVDSGGVLATQAFGVVAPCLVFAGFDQRMLQAHEDVIVVVAE